MPVCCCCRLFYRLKPLSQTVRMILPTLSSGAKSGAGRPSLAASSV
ncbi:hypothetical protein F528_1007 [Neisseria meningitidis 992008]|nr:hypothetical protein F528_1007 [Neisseria meningitidis 992008]